jgi:hypothetical protein
MRRLVVVSAALFIVACGPDPNAVLPGTVRTPSAGGTKTVPSGGAGGATTTPPSSGGAAGGAGGANPFAGSSGSSGGTAGSGGVKSTGGTVGSGGVKSTGGTVGGGGTTTATTGALTTYTFGSGAEPCASPKDISGGNVKDIGLTATCLRTADDFAGWNCSGMDDRTIKVNTVAVKCGDAPPPKAGSFYSFDISAGTNAWAGFSWFCNFQGCGGNHAIPSCGHYPAWQSGGSAAPCSDSTGDVIDAGTNG